MSDNTVFKTELEERINKINEQIESYLPEEKGHQSTIFEAMNYSVRAGGKRLRPLFMQEICRLFTGEVQPAVVPFMAAIEMIHTSSLVHDDLPCMDDDMMRRGKASTWAEYGEDMGVLAGDALMIYAFEVAAKAFNEVSEADDLKRVGRAIEILAAKTGIYGMIGGQVVDVELTGKPISEEQLDFIYRYKTRALLEASLMAGAALAGAAEEEIAQIECVGRLVGLAFQIQDDILDLTSTAEELGKPIGSDLRNEKTTYVSLHGMREAEEAVEEYSKEAVEILENLSEENEFLDQLIVSLIHRKK